MTSVPSEFCRFEPDNTICATLIAVGSFTARLPVRVAREASGLTPVQLWQLAQAPSKISLPYGSTLAATPSFGSAGAESPLGAGRSGVETPYRTGKDNTQTLESDPPLRHGSYRALACTAHNFARESLMDELAAAVGKDPLEFRLEHLENDRLRAVLEVAAARFGWGKVARPAGHGGHHRGRRVR